MPYRAFCSEFYRIHYHYQGQRAPGSWDSIGPALFVSRNELGEGVSM